jgi:hypothetical protein
MNKFSNAEFPNNDSIRNKQNFVFNLNSNANNFSNNNFCLEQNKFFYNALKQNQFLYNQNTPINKFNTCNNTFNYLNNLKNTDVESKYLNNEENSGLDPNKAKPNDNNKFNLMENLALQKRERANTAFNLVDLQADKKKKKPFVERIGDWVCLKCKNLNFSFRLACNRCQLSKAEN